MTDFLRMQLALSRARAGDARAVLATLVWRQGSTYRRAGARALVVGDEVTGLLSGGCLEADIAEHAKMMLAKGDSSALVSYDLASDEADSLLGIGHGCKGTLGIVLEALSPSGGPEDPMALLSAHHEGDDDSAVAHVPVTSPANGVRRLWRLGAGKATREHVQGSLGDDERTRLSALLDRALREKKTITEPSGVVAEYLPRPLSLLVVGAGVDALPVVDFALGLGFRVTVLDHRTAALSHPRLAATTRERVLVKDLAAATARTRARAALVMTHNLKGDEAALTGLLGKGPTEAAPREYVGVLGPRARTEKMLTNMGLTLSARPEVRAPAGLDLGGDGADAVALAIVSEIHARLHGRDGRALTHKEGPIHDP